MPDLIEFKIGISRDSGTGALSIPPAGTVVPRPTDIRHMWRPPTGRSIGGEMTLGTFESMDWIYAMTGDAKLEATILTLYDPDNPLVWVQIYDPYYNGAWWYEATMLEPHAERVGGEVFASIVVPFRRMTRYVEP